MYLRRVSRSSTRRQHKTAFRCRLWFQKRYLRLDLFAEKAGPAIRPSRPEISRNENFKPRVCHPKTETPLKKLNYTYRIEQRRLIIVEGKRKTFYRRDEFLFNASTFYSGIDGAGE